MRVALAAVLLVLAVACGEAPENVSDDSPSSPAPQSELESPSAEFALAPGWHRLSPAPLSARAGHSAVWTGAELIVWGGRDHGDGAAFDPVEGTWRVLARSPLSPRSRHVAVWTGVEMLVWGGEAGGGQYPLADGAAYDPERNVWRTLPASPLEAGRFGHSAVWTGTEMIIFGGYTTVSVEGSIGSESGETAAYDPVTNSWRSLESGTPVWNHAAVWTGKEMFVWGGDGLDAFLGSGGAFDPTANTWRDLARSPLEGRVGSAAAWTGKEMVIHGGASNLELSVEAAAYDPAADSWRELPPSPLGFVAWHQSVWTGTELIVCCRGRKAAAYDPATDDWRRLPPMPVENRIFHTGLYAGNATVFWGGEGCQDACYRDDGAVYVTP
jgi:hypothetical protein